MPLGDDLQPAGEPFMAMTKDISHASITIIHTEAVTAPMMAVKMTDLGGSVLHSAVEVLRCSPVDRYFEIVGRYVTKIYEPTPKTVEIVAAATTPEPERARRWLSFRRT